MIATWQQQSCKQHPVSIPANLWSVEGVEADTALVKALCRWTKMPPSTLAKAAGLTPSTLLRYFNATAETRLSVPTMEKLKVRFPDFPGWRGDLPDQVGMAGERPDPNEKPEELVYVRQLDISYAFGEGAVIEDYPATGLIPFNLPFIRAISHADTGKLFIGTGHGDSMEPTLLRSDLLMVDMSQQHISVSEMVWALNYAGGGMVKRVRRIRDDGRDKFLLMSDNKAVGDQVAEIDEVHVTGKVIWVGRRM